MIVTRLNAKTQSYEMGGGFGGLSQSDIAAACKGLSELQEALIYFYWCGQNGYRQYLVDAAEQELRRVKSDLVDVLALILVDDLYNSACSSCNGTGLNREKRKCGHCDGSGRKMLSERVLAHAVGMNDTTFRRKHLKQYRAVYVYFEKLAHCTKDKLMANLG